MSPRNRTQTQTSNELYAALAMALSEDSSAPGGLHNVSENVPGTDPRERMPGPPAAAANSSQSSSQNGSNNQSLNGSSGETAASLPNGPTGNASTPKTETGWWTLKNKAALLAVALGTLPVLVVGGIATSIAGNQLSKQVVTQQEQLANAINLQIQDFVTLRRQESGALDSDPSSEPFSEASAGTSSGTSSGTSPGTSPEEALGLAEGDDLSALLSQRVATMRQGSQTEEDALQFSVVSDSQSEGNQEIETLFPNYAVLRDRSETAITFKDVSTADDQPYLITYAPIPDLENNWGVLVYQPLSTAFAARQSLIFTLLSGTVLTVLLVSTLAAYFSNIATQPIIEASRAVAKLGQGKFDTRLSVKGNDELSALATNINIMATQLEDQLSFIEETAQRQGLFQAQATIAQQQQQQREAMQQELMALIQSVEGASQGDLTVRADLSGGEIGIVADVFNSIVESLRKIVVQVKQTTTQVNSSIGSNQLSIRQLADDALSQVDEISHTLASMQQMSASIQVVATNAQQAAAVAHNASSTAQRGTQAMDQTVSSMSGLRSTVATTTKKVKQLGESSQQISQVVTLINEIALKTNLLAINASIEAAHAGEEGQGFAVVASEVGQLAEQSAKATKDIERIVQDIQSGTREVVEAMELSTSQVVEGSSKLNETKESLAEILSVSEEIDQLVRSISKATVSQANTSQTVTQLMQQITASSQRTSDFSKEVDSALQGTVEVARSLEKAIDKFKVDVEPV